MAYDSSHYCHVAVIEAKHIPTLNRVYFAIEEPFGGGWGDYGKSAWLYYQAGSMDEAIIMLSVLKTAMTNGTKIRIFYTASRPNIIEHIHLFNQ